MAHNVSTVRGGCVDDEVCTHLEHIFSELKPEPVLNAGSDDTYFDPVAAIRAAEKGDKDSNSFEESDEDDDDDDDNDDGDLPPQFAQPQVASSSAESRQQHADDMTEMFQQGYADDGQIQVQQTLRPLRAFPPASCHGLHNEWERISKKKHSFTLRCLTCGSSWKTKLSFFSKCRAFYHGKCSAGAKCPNPHIYSRAYCLSRTLANHAGTAQVAPTPQNTAPKESRFRMHHLTLCGERQRALDRRKQQFGGRPPHGASHPMQGSQQDGYERRHGRHHQPANKQPQRGGDGGGDGDGATKTQVVYVPVVVGHVGVNPDGTSIAPQGMMPTRATVPTPPQQGAAGAPMPLPAYFPVGPQGAPMAMAASVPGGIAKQQAGLQFPVQQPIFTTAAVQGVMPTYMYHTQPILQQPQLQPQAMAAATPRCAEAPLPAMAAIPVHGTTSL